MHDEDLRVVSGDAAAVAESSKDKHLLAAFAVAKADRGVLPKVFLTWGAAAARQAHDAGARTQQGPELVGCCARARAPPGP